VPNFDYAFTVRAPLAAVGAFHHHTRVLKRLMPPLVIMQIHRADPMMEGAVSEFTLWFGPIPVRWTALHFNVDLLHGFTDTQVRGPLKRWQHTHAFVAEGDGVTRVREHVEYEYKGGLGGLFSRLVFGRWALVALFTYRERITRRALEKQPRRR